MCNSIKSGKINKGGVAEPGLHTVANRFAGSLKLPKGKEYAINGKMVENKKKNDGQVPADLWGKYLTQLVALLSADLFYSSQRMYRDKI